MLLVTRLRTGLVGARSFFLYLQALSTGTLARLNRLTLFAMCDRVRTAIITMFGVVFPGSCFGKWVVLKRADYDVGYMLKSFRTAADYSD